MFFIQISPFKARALSCAILHQTPCRTASHVRHGTLLLCGRAFPCLTLKYRRLDKCVVLRDTASDALPHCESRTTMYAPVSQRMIIYRHCHICGSALFFYIRCSLSRRENAQTFALLLVPRELSRSSLIFTPRSDGLRHRFNGCFRAHGVPVAKSLISGWGKIHPNIGV